jgi:hypothetical protein
MEGLADKHHLHLATVQGPLTPPVTHLPVCGTHIEKSAWVDRWGEGVGNCAVFRYGFI